MWFLSKSDTFESGIAAFHNFNQTKKGNNDEYKTDSCRRNRGQSVVARHPNRHCFILGDCPQRNVGSSASRRDLQSACS